MQIQEVINKLIVDTGILVNRNSIYNYEDKGLVMPKRSENGYRSYSKENYDDIRALVGMCNIGINLDEIKDVKSGKRTSFPLKTKLRNKLNNIKYCLSVL